jgi:hypothetical protein
MFARKCKTYVAEEEEGPRIVGYTTGQLSGNKTYGMSIHPDASVGDQALCFVGIENDSDPQGVWTATGMTKIIQTTGYYDYGEVVLFRRQLTGTESTITVECDGNRNAGIALVIVRGSGISTPTQANNSGGSTTIDPPANTPVGGAKDYVWFVGVGKRSGAVLNSLDSDFSKLVSVSSYLDVCSAEKNASSENPTAFTYSYSSRFSCIHFAVHP